MAVFTRRQFSAEKGICHIPEATITKRPGPSGFAPDPLTDVIRDGARTLIEQAIEAELATLMAAFAKDKLEDGRARLVRHGHLPERDVMTGVGPVPVKVPRVRDRGAAEDKKSPVRGADMRWRCGAARIAPGIQRSRPLQAMTLPPPIHSTPGAFYRMSNVHPCPLGPRRVKPAPDRKMEPRDAGPHL